MKRGPSTILWGFNASIFRANVFQVWTEYTSMKPLTQKLLTATIWVKETSD